MKKISVFANFYINDYERFLRMKDSFLSFNKAKIDMWVINVRGKFSKKSIDFFNTKLKKKIFISAVLTLVLGLMTQNNCLTKLIQNMFFSGLRTISA